MRKTLVHHDRALTYHKMNRFEDAKNRELEEKNKLIESQKLHLEDTLADLRKSVLKLSFIKSEMSQQVGYYRIIGESKEIKSIIDLDLLESIANVLFRKHASPKAIRTSANICTQAENGVHSL